MNKQVTRCAFDLFVYAGGAYRRFDNYPKNVQITVGTISWKPYYYSGKAYDEDIGGGRKSQLGGYRLEGSLSWEHLLSTTNLVNVVHDSVTGVEHVFHNDIVLGPLGPSTAVTFVLGAPIDDYYNGMFLTGGSGTNVLILDYYGGNGTAILQGSTSFGSASNPVEITTNPNTSPYLVFYPDASNTENQAVVIDRVSFGMQIDRTITEQPISIAISGANVTTEIPEYYR